MENIFKNDDQIDHKRVSRPISHINRLPDDELLLLIYRGQMYDSLSTNSSAQVVATPAGFLASHMYSASSSS